jgi:ribosomal protein L7/L12
MTYMHEQEIAQHITSLQARMNRMEAMMQQLLLTLSSSHSQGDQTMQLQAMLQELRGGADASAYTPSSNAYAVGANAYSAGANQATVAPQEAPEIRAIRERLLAGDKIKAIALYRAYYNVDLRTAKAAIDTM